ncbi:MAG: hypothetical protein EOR07_27235 [Mesorhizobium sp.]|nr:MAG: hypothetical protein EOR07_27235 [Mesorhizobium sp.]
MTEPAFGRRKSYATKKTKTEKRFASVMDELTSYASLLSKMCWNYGLSSDALCQQNLVVKV